MRDFIINVGSSALMAALAELVVSVYNAPQWAGAMTFIIVYFVALRRTRLA